MAVMSSPHWLAPLTLTSVSVPLPASFDGAPAPQHVLGVEDEQVAPADGQELRLGRRSCRSTLRPSRTTAVALLALEVDPVDGLGRADR